MLHGVVGYATIKQKEQPPTKVVDLVNKLVRIPSSLLGQKFRGWFSYALKL